MSLRVLPGALSETDLHHLNAVKGVLRCRNGDKKGRFGELGPLNLLPFAGEACFPQNTRLLLSRLLRLHGSSKVTGSFAGPQIRLSLCPLGLSNSSKGFLVPHIFCSLSSQALNCFPLGAACMQGSPEPWLLSTDLFWQLKSTVRSPIPRRASQKVTVAISCRSPKY